MTDATGPLVVGADVGGTSAKVLVSDDDGRVVGRGTGPGGNIRSSAGDPACNIAAALRAALAGTDPRRVLAGCSATKAPPSGWPASGTGRGLGRPRPSPMASRTSSCGTRPPATRART